MRKPIYHRSAFFIDHKLFGKTCSLHLLYSANLNQKRKIYASMQKSAKINFGTVS